MWRFCVCAVVLAATPALSQTLQYSSDERAHRERHQGHRSGRCSTACRPHEIVEPSHMGPAPTGFWYRCDMPAGYYPYVPACQTPWLIVPSAPSGPFR